jgi:cell division septation protein DedD
MQLYNRNLVCPLCRKSVDDGASRTLPTTKLCENCRSLVHTIVPNKNWNSNATPEIKYFSPVAHNEVEAHTRYDEQYYLDADGLDDFGTDSYSQTREIDSSVSDQNGNQSQAVWQSGLQTQAEWPSPQQQDRWAAPTAQTTSFAEPPRWQQKLVEVPAPIEDYAVQSAQPIYHEEVAPPIYHEELAQPVYREEIEQPVHQAEPVYSHDPWENPLPAGETSLNEWPILVHTQRRKSASGLKALIGVAAVAALSVAGYFFAYKPYFAAKPATSQNAVAVNTPTQPSGETSASSSKQPAPSETTQPASAATPPVTPLSTGEKPNAAAAPGEIASGEGAFSMQAMSSSNQEEANKFSEKLLRAGISAYVVQADIPGRGRWYRVRVGKFGTREEAMKYGEQSKMRAKAAGIKLDLIVSPYEKP